MISYPNIGPDIVRFSLMGLNLQVRWYGLLYVISFIIAFFLYKRTLKLRDVKLAKEQYESAIFHVMLGVI
ncbi:MAG: prolipoprotein diacylglyceryl transferase, partial [Candidatus Cloacimonetes bacterium]|nr:prolipoprotein diacylglyceryl transferase [Candidatus Cloacimonadota bacterium]